MFALLLACSAPSQDARVQPPAEEHREKGDSAGADTSEEGLDTADTADTSARQVFTVACEMPADFDPNTDSLATTITRLPAGLVPGVSTNRITTWRRLAPEEQARQDVWDQGIVGEWSLGGDLSVTAAGEIVLACDGTSYNFGKGPVSFYPYTLIIITVEP